MDNLLAFYRGYSNNSPTFYLCQDGEIFSLGNIINAFHLITGHDPVYDIKYEKEFYNFLNNLLNTTLHELKNPTVEYLIKKNAFVHAIRKYRTEHKCTLVEAKEACEKIRKEINNRQEK